MHLHTQPLKAMLHLRSKKIVVFEYAQYAKVIYNAQPEEEFCLAPVCRSYTKTIEIIEQGAECQQGEEAGAPIAVEKVARREYQYVL